MSSKGGTPEIANDVDDDADGVCALGQLVKPNSHIDLHTLMFQSALAESRFEYVQVDFAVFFPSLNPHDITPQHTQHTCFHHPHNHNLLQQQQFSRVSQSPFFLEVTPSVSSSVTHTHTHTPGTTAKAKMASSAPTEYVE